MILEQRHYLNWRCCARDLPSSFQLYNLNNKKRWRCPSSYIIHQWFSVALSIVNENEIFLPFFLVEFGFSLESFLGKVKPMNGKISSFLHKAKLGKRESWDCGWARLSFIKLESFPLDGNEMNSTYHPLWEWFHGNGDYILYFEWECFSISCTKHGGSSIPTSRFLGM